MFAVTVALISARRAFRDQIKAFDAQLTRQAEMAREDRSREAAGRLGIPLLRLGRSLKDPKSLAGALDAWPEAMLVSLGVIIDGELLLRLVEFEYGVTSRSEWIVDHPEPPSGVDGQWHREYVSRMGELAEWIKWLGLSLAAHQRPGEPLPPRPDSVVHYEFPDPQTVAGDTG